MLKLSDQRLLFITNAIFYSIKDYYLEDTKAEQGFTSDNVEELILEMKNYKFTYKSMREWITLVDNIQSEPWANNKHYGDCTNENTGCLRCEFVEIQTYCALILQTYKNDKIESEELKDFFNYLVFAAMFSFMEDVHGGVINFAAYAMHRYKNPNKYPNFAKIAKQISEQIYDFLETEE